MKRLSHEKASELVEAREDAKAAMTQIFFDFNSYCNKSQLKLLNKHIKKIKNILDRVTDESGADKIMQEM